MDAIKTSLRLALVDIGCHLLTEWCVDRPQSATHIPICTHIHTINTCTHTRTHTHTHTHTHRGNSLYLDTFMAHQKLSLWYISIKFTIFQYYIYHLHPTSDTIQYNTHSHSIPGSSNKYLNINILMIIISHW